MGDGIKEVEEGGCCSRESVTMRRRANGLKNRQRKIKLGFNGVWFGGKRRP